jgi:hypothetical protein
MRGLPARHLMHAIQIEVEAIAALVSSGVEHQRGAALPDR